MTIEIKRPKDLTLASAVENGDYLVLDRGEAGVFKVSIAQLSAFFLAGTFQALALSGTDEPEGVIEAPPPTFYMRITEGVREIWLKTDGGSTAQGWELLVKAQ
ncbi:MAG: hypothetical protein AB9869_01250 [Verrucomicrobiia bacterium]